ncbi:MAG TPA: DUF4328 domain-containing protein [Pyrinomonadaceae bacterium]|jgi:hypothetical protein
METPFNPGQTPGGLVSSEPFVSAHTRASVVVALFVAYIVVAASSFLANLAQLALPPLVLAAAEGEQEQLTLGDLANFFVALATFFVFLALVVAFLVWLHRVVKNLPALGNPKAKIEHTPGWAVATFFIPIASLFLPYKAVKEVWVKSDPSVHSEADLFYSTAGSAPPLLLGWWLTWVASNILDNFTWQFGSRADGMEGFLTGVELVSDVVGIVSAALAIMVVRGIDRRQAERARHVTCIPNIPPPPPDFRPATHEARDAAPRQTPPPFGGS